MAKYIHWRKIFLFIRNIMKSKLLIVFALFLLGCNSFFGTSANASAAATSGFLGSELSHEKFVSAVKQLPDIQLKKDQLIEAFDRPITVNGREWSISSVTDCDAAREILADKFVIKSIGVLSACELEANAFEIDSEGRLRRPIEVIGRMKYKAGNDILQARHIIMFLETSLTAEEKKNPLLLYYRYSMTFEKQSNDSCDEKALQEVEKKAFTSSSRLIKDVTQRNKALDGL